MDLEEILAVYGISTMKKHAIDEECESVAGVRRNTAAGDRSIVEVTSNQADGEGVMNSRTKDIVYADALDSIGKANPMYATSMPRLEGGNVIVDIDETEHQKGIKENSFSVFGRLNLQKGQLPPNTMELKQKFSEI